MEAPSALVEVVERRLDFLERLAEGALRKHELVDELDHSRSTVNRAIDELEAAGLVAGETDGYRTTLTGRLLAQSYRRFLTVAADVDAASETLAPLGPDIALSPAALRDADTYRAAAPDPYRPLERLDAVLADADSIAAALPTLPSPRLLDRCRSTAAAGGSVDLALTDRTYHHAREHYADTLGGLAAGDDAAVVIADGIDVGCLVADETAVLVVFDDDGGVHGIAESTDTEAVEWVRERVCTLCKAGYDVTNELAAIRDARDRGCEEPDGAGDTGDRTTEGTEPAGSTTGRGGHDENTSDAKADGFTAVEARALADLGRVAAERGDVETAVDRLTAAIDLGYRIESVRAVVPAAEELAALLAAHPDSDELDVDAPGSIPESAATDPAAYRDLADRWRVDGDEVAADFTTSESESESEAR
jgi:predicted transcriptional regulator